MFNVVNMKHRNATEAWLHIKDAEGNPMYASVKNGKLADGEDKKTELIPVRIKFKSIHSDAFRKAFFKMNVNLANLKNGKKKEYEELAKEKAQVSKEQVVSEITDAFLAVEDLAIDMVVELATDWQGFFDENKNSLEFNPDYLRFIVSQTESYHVLKQIRESFNDAEVFMEA